MRRADFGRARGTPDGTGAACGRFHVRGGEAPSPAANRPRMRHIILAALIVLPFAVPQAAPAATPDPNYAAALAAVDGFLFSWSKRNADGGMAYVAPDLVHAIGAAKIRDFLIGTSSPNNEAFEISEGQKGAGASFIFPVRLVWMLQGATSQLETAKIRVQQRGGKWLVVSLPYGGKTTNT